MTKHESAAVIQSGGQQAGELAGYGLREQTRTDHLRMVMSYLGWRTADEVSVKELDEFLLARAMEHDAPSLLFRLACEHLITTRVVRPGPVKLSLFAVCGSHWSNYLAHIEPSRAVIIRNLSVPDSGHRQG